jgi:hypothetical protein
MTRKWLMTAAIVIAAFIAPIGIGTADAYGGGHGGGGFHGGGFRGGDFRGGNFYHRGFDGRRDFRGDGFRFGGVFGSYYPRYYGYGTCYLTVYGTTACY